MVPIQTDILGSYVEQIPMLCAHSARRSHQSVLAYPSRLDEMHRPPAHSYHSHLSIRLRLRHRTRIGLDAEPFSHHGHLLIAPMLQLVDQHLYNRHSTDKSQSTHSLKPENARKFLGRKSSCTNGETCHAYHGDTAWGDQTLLPQPSDVPVTFSSDGHLFTSFKV